MLTFAMGEAIRSMRIRAGYTQEELSFGICAVSTLSRIENGRESASRQIFEALASRMMGMGQFMVSYDSKEEVESQKLYRRILFYLEQRKLEEAEQAMEEYRMRLVENSHFCRQFMLYTGAVFRSVRKENNTVEKEEEILKDLYRALKMTMPNYREIMQGGERHRILLTYHEIFILNVIGVWYLKKDENVKALETFCYLKRYSEHREFDRVDDIPLYPMIISNMANVLEKIGQFPEAARLCDTGIDACLNIGKHTVLPYLLCTKSRCHAALGNKETAQNCMEQAKAILDIGRNYKGYMDFGEFYEAKESIYVTL